MTARKQKTAFRKKLRTLEIHTPIRSENGYSVEIRTAGKREALQWFRQIRRCKPVPVVGEKGPEVWTGCDLGRMPDTGITAEYVYVENGGWIFKGYK